MTESSWSESSVDNVRENESLPQSHFIYGKKGEKSTSISDQVRLSYKSYILVNYYFLFKKYIKLLEKCNI